MRDAVGSMDDVQARLATLVCLICGQTRLELILFCDSHTEAFAFVARCRSCRIRYLIDRDSATRAAGDGIERVECPVCGGSDCDVVLTCSLASRRYIETGRLALELNSDSPQAISRFFSERRIGFPVPAESLEITGWRLVGARVHAIASHKSALCLYRDARDRMIVCQMYKGHPAELPPGSEIIRSSDAVLYVFRSSGRRAVFWQDGTILCVLASDIAEEEILRIALAKAVKART